MKTRPVLPPLDEQQRYAIDESIAYLRTSRKSFYDDIKNGRIATSIRRLAICYYGWKDELVALGVATPDMLGRRVKGKKRIDTDGDRFHVSWYWRLDDNRQPQLYYKFTRIKPLEMIHHLPLAREAVVEYLRWLKRAELKHKRLSMKA